jgi:hypothetical protein
MSNHGTALSDDTIIRVDRSTPVVYPHYWWLVCSTSFEVRNTSIVSSRAMAAPAPMNRPSTIPSASANAVFGALVYNGVVARVRTRESVIGMVCYWIVSWNCCRKLSYRLR